MASRFLLVLLLPIISNAKINIDIITASSINETSLSYSGIDTKKVTAKEIELFKIDKKSLISAVKQHYGVKPTDVFIKSPTPWGDLYKTYNWEEVTRVLTVESARVKGVTKKPVIILSHDFENVSNNTIKVNTGISQTVENTISTVWSKENEYSMSQELDYDINVLFAKLSGTTGFSYTTSWGESEESSQTTTIGSTSGVETELKKGQAVTAVLTANRGYVEVEIFYKAFLRGNLVVNFRQKYNGHHFWGPPIDSVMSDGNITNLIRVKETIKVGFYTDASLFVYDKLTRLPL